MKPPQRQHHQRNGTACLNEDRQAHDGPAPEPVGDLAGDQHQQQGGRKLDQTDQPQIERIARQVIDLPASKGYTTTVVLVDKLTKKVHLARCTKEVIAMEYAKPFADKVF